MKKFYLALPASLLILSCIFLYFNSGVLSANDKDGKSCKISCTEKSKTQRNEIEAAGQWASYEFTTEKICCDKIKSELEKELMSLSAVKEVKIGEACSVSGTTRVIILYDANEMNEDNISSFVQNINYKCQGEKDCSGKCIDKKDCSKEGLDKKGCNSKKSKDSKDL